MKSKPKIVVERSRIDAGCMARGCWCFGVKRPIYRTAFRGIFWMHHEGHGFRLVKPIKRH